MRKILPIALLLLMTAVAQAQAAEGDQHWQRRAEGHSGGRAKAAQVDAAIASYQRAIGQNPNDLEPRWKLLRAYRYKGAYAASGVEEKKRVYSAAKQAGEEAVAIVNRLLTAKGVPVAKATEKQMAEMARSIPGAGETLLWDAVNWGEWALAYGKLAAAKQGAADRIRRQATIAMLIDPRLEGGSPARVLGRLHDQTPRIPFITGWASSKEAVRLLNESLKIDRSNKITIVFLAEAMVSNDPKTRPQAVQMLKNALAAPDDPDYIVEQMAASEDARALLKKWGA
ncbi:MAG TPA: hypothetical protein VFL80_08945 [Thermoanaerobaculia bacterium]|nr:hypothetical protein [Thermoanaerobaculia bacterium]